MVVRVVTDNDCLMVVKIVVFDVGVTIRVVVGVMVN